MQIHADRHDTVIAVKKNHGTVISKKHLDSFDLPVHLQPQAAEALKHLYLWHFRMHFGEIFKYEKS